ncbi:esterase [[Mycobacterium] wendilense]|uniref:Esterase n=1 Tax=[Mycobacterium] wendilense TaxID=3064284 RepID=A0ABM9MK27_9MYCO|nr:esterase [Mycolicibacterium sp. MU0050]CAJ1587192.1 esterase [Mycolicibacterium sp. MU0050]
MQTQQYAPGRSVDVFGQPTDPTVLVWHGTQTDARSTVGSLADQLAGHGLRVVVPDWDSHAADRGRADLLNSVEFAQSDASGPLAVVGWSLGAVAAAGLAIRADEYNVALRHVVGLGGAFMVRDPLSGETLGPQLRTARVGAPFTLLHGVDDDVVPVTASRAFAADLQAVGWPVRVVELAADHGNIAGAQYNSAQDRYEPTSDPDTRRVVTEVAGHIAEALADPPPAPHALRS